MLLISKIPPALEIIESQLSNALRIRSISHFLASISSIEIMMFSEISTFLGRKQNKLFPRTFSELRSVSYGSTDA